MKLREISKVKNLSGKRVLLRADFNVPLKNGKIKEAYKIEKSLPTIEFLSKKGARVILASHLGRPSGFEKKLSLKPVAIELGKLLKKKIKLVSVGDWRKVQAAAAKMKKGEIILLENIRFIKSEETNDPKVAKALADLADIFVLDGFAVAHRDSASVSGVAKHLPSFAGLLLAEEVAGLSRLLEKPKRPFVAVIGGIKMETKIPLIKKFLARADRVLLGGGIANTCFWAKGMKTGASVIEKNFKTIARSLLKNKKVVLPVDVIVGWAKGEKARAIQLDRKFKALDSRTGIFDIGPRTISLFAKHIKSANTLVWNGAMGMFEQRPYQFGTYSIARLFGSRAKGKAFGVCGGGETVEVLKKLKLMDEIDLVSTGGGAMLEFLSGKRLPGVAAVFKK